MKAVCEAKGEASAQLIDHLKKGDLVYLEGRNETRTWVKDRQTHYTTEVVLRQFGSALQILQRKDADRPDAEQGRTRAPAADGPREFDDRFRYAGARNPLHR